MRLKEVTVSANTGLDAIKRAPIVEEETGLKCIRIQDISQGKDFDDWGNTVTTENDYKKFKLKINDLLVARTGATVGVSYLVKKDYNAVFNNGSIRLRFSKDVNTRFVYYVFKSKSFGQYIDNVSCVATQPNLRVENLLRFTIPDIDKEQQDEIVEILEKYDDLIENNTKRIKLLEQMAENLYKEWFVRFRFPGHENAEFENGIPKYWDTLQVKDLATLKSGYAFKSEWFCDEGYCVAKIKDIGGIIMDTKDFSFVSEENCSKAKNYLLVEGDLTIALTGATIGKISIVPKYNVPIYTNQRLGKFFNGNNPIENVAFLYCFFAQPEITQTILNLSNSSSAQPNISPEQVENIKFYGNKELIKQFNAVASNLFKEILHLYYSNENLIKQRDLLLPRLMSGKLEVK